MDNHISTLIVARSKQLRAGLQALLSTIPEIQSIYEAKNSQTALSAARHCPTLMLLDFDLPDDEFTTAFQQLKHHWPQTRSIVMVDNDKEGGTAQAAGADLILTKGILAAKFLSVVESQLPSHLGDK